MELPIVRISHARFKAMNIEILRDENQSEDDYVPPRSGDYALVKIESLNDKIAVEEFIKNLRS